MIRHWQRERQPGWKIKLTINAVGAVATGMATVIVVFTKFADGAWIVAIVVPLLVLNFKAIRRHYAHAQQQP